MDGNKRKQLNQALLAPDEEEEELEQFRRESFRKFGIEGSAAPLRERRRPKASWPSANSFKKYWRKCKGEFESTSRYPRLINKNHRKTYNIRRKNKPVKRFADLYHTVLAWSWWQLFITVTLTRFIVHLIYASLYYADRDGLQTGTNDTADFFDCFFFSVQTMDTFAYGRINPLDIFTNAISCIQSYMGIFMTAVLAGIIIGKISRPSRQRKSILWSSQAVINNVEKYWEGGEDDGHYTDDGKVNSLVFRLANMRNGQIYAPKFTLLLMRRESPSDNDEGVLNGDGGKASGSWKIHELNFEIFNQVGRVRSKTMSNPLLPLSWTIVHPLDKDSPLYMATAETMVDEQIEIIGILDGLYEDSGTPFQARCSYTVDVWDARFAECCRVNERGRFVLDYGKLDSIVPISRKSKHQHL